MYRLSFPSRHTRTHQSLIRQYDISTHFMLNHGPCRSQEQRINSTQLNSFPSLPPSLPPRPSLPAMQSAPAKRRNPYTGQAPTPCLSPSPSPLPPRHGAPSPTYPQSSDEHHMPPVRLIARAKRHAIDILVSVVRKEGPLHRWPGRRRPHWRATSSASWHGVGIHSSSRSGKLVEGSSKAAKGRRRAYQEQRAQAVKR